MPINSRRNAGTASERQSHAVSWSQARGSRGSTSRCWERRPVERRVVPHDPHDVLSKPAEGDHLTAARLLCLGRRHVAGCTTPYRSDASSPWQPLRKPSGKRQVSDSAHIIPARSRSPSKAPDAQQSGPTFLHTPPAPRGGSAACAGERRGHRMSPRRSASQPRSPVGQGDNATLREFSPLLRRTTTRHAYRPSSTAHRRRSSAAPPCWSRQSNKRRFPLGIAGRPSSNVAIAPRSADHFETFSGLGETPPLGAADLKPFFARMRRLEE